MYRRGFLQLCREVEFGLEDYSKLPLTWYSDQKEGLLKVGEMKGEGKVNALIGL